jgi:hypothetical protein
MLNGGRAFALGTSRARRLLLFTSVRRTFPQKGVFNCTRAAGMKFTKSKCQVAFSNSGKELISAGLYGIFSNFNATEFMQ